jgi:hypothetical protein
MKTKISEQIMYDGAKRHKPLHDDHTISIMPKQIQRIMQDENMKADEHEKKHSILLTPHPEPYK